MRNRIAYYRIIYNTFIDTFDALSDPNNCLKILEVKADRQSSRPRQGMTCFDGRLMTLENTFEFFTVIQGPRLSEQKNHDIVAFMRVLWIYSTLKGR
ncbi:MAG: hypothetical protein ABIK28_01815 [Planctomycetota bacterium]